MMTSMKLEMTILTKQYDKEDMVEVTLMSLYSMCKSALPAYVMCIFQSPISRVKIYTCL